MKLFSFFRPNKDIRKSVERNDGWGNILTNLNTKNSRSGNTFVKKPYLAIQPELEAIYLADGIGARIVNIVVEDALRGFIEADKLLIKELQRIKAKQLILDAGCQGRLYGGSIVVAFIDDNLSYDSPINFNKINKLASLKVFDKFQISFSDQDLCRDFSKSYFGEPEYFTIESKGASGAEGYAMKVHRSRCFIFGGDRLPASMRSNNGLWDVSVLQRCMEALKNYNNVTNASAEIVQDFIQVILKMTGLSDKIINQQDSGLLSRINLIDMTRSVSNMILLDGDGAEDYEKKASSVAGLKDLWDGFCDAICAHTGIPMTKLFGKSPGGLNSTGESDIRQWYDIVRSYQTDQIEPCIDWLIEILKHQTGWKNKPKNFEWEFPALTSPSDIEQAEIEKKYAEIDWGYADRGALNLSEAYSQRFGTGKFISKIQVTASDTELIEIDNENLDLTEEKETEKEIEEKRALELVNSLHSKVRN